MVPNRVLGAALWGGSAGQRRHQRARARAASTDIDIDADARAAGGDGHGAAPRPCHARLVVAADGAHSQVRAAAGIEARRGGLWPGRDRGATSRPTRPHDGTAYERFTPPGPLARAAAARWQLRRRCGRARPSARQQLLALERCRLSSRSCRATSAGAPGDSCASAGARILSVEADARRSDRRAAHGADRQCRPGAASGGRPGIQSGAARCGDAGGS